MEHLLGCHGEWMFVAQAAAALPLVGAWIKVVVFPRFHRHTPAVEGKE